MLLLYSESWCQLALVHAGYVVILCSPLAQQRVTLELTAHKTDFLAVCRYLLGWACVSDNRFRTILLESDPTLISDWKSGSWKEGVPSEFVQRVSSIAALVPHQQ